MKRAGLQAISAVDFWKTRAKLAQNSCNENRTRMVHTSQIFTSEILEKKDQQTNLTSNQSRYTPERGAHLDRVELEQTVT